jgi:hypothetical protein
VATPFFALIGVLWLIGGSARDQPVAIGLGVLAVLGCLAYSMRPKTKAERQVEDALKRLQEEARERHPELDFLGQGRRRVAFGVVKEAADGAERKYRVLLADRKPTEAGVYRVRLWGGMFGVFLAGYRYRELHSELTTALSYYGRQGLSLSEAEFQKIASSTRLPTLLQAIENCLHKTAFNANAETLTDTYIQAIVDSMEPEDPSDDYWAPLAGVPVRHALSETALGMFDLAPFP